MKWSLINFIKKNPNNLKNSYKNDKTIEKCGKKETSFVEKRSSTKSRHMGWVCVIISKTMAKNKIKKGDTLSLYYSVLYLKRKTKIR